MVKIGKPINLWVFVDLVNMDMDGSIKKKILGFPKFGGKLENFISLWKRVSATPLAILAIETEFHRRKCLHSSLRSVSLFSSLRLSIHLLSSSRRRLANRDPSSVVVAL